MTQQVSRSLQFYLASGSGRDQPEKILVCGGCANISGVSDVISSRVGISAEKGDPLGQMKLSSRAKAQAVARDATALLTACGLALRSLIYKQMPSSWTGLTPGFIRRRGRVPGTVCSRLPSRRALRC